MNKPLHPLRGVRILSLALNLPGPAALMRLQHMGARCTKLQSPAGDPMAVYSPKAYRAMHDGVRVLQADLKTPLGQKRLARELARTDLLLTSFRPSALVKLGLEWPQLHRLYPSLSMVAIVGSPGARAEEPGHDLTYLAEQGLVTGTDLPATLYADMAGALAASEAALQAVLQHTKTGRSSYQEVALSQAAQFLALPRTWGLTTPMHPHQSGGLVGGFVGGTHAGYRVYSCLDGRVAVAALEPHFAQALCQAVGLTFSTPQDMLLAGTHQAIQVYMASKTRKQLGALSKRLDIPLLCMK